MKLFKTPVILILTLAVALFACKGDDDPVDPETLAARKLSGTWTANGGSVKADGHDVTSDYNGFEISFSELKDGQFVYTIQHGNHAFEDISMDTWTFGNTSLTQIQRGADDVMIDYSFEDDFLLLEFTIPDPLDDDGRIKGMFGNFEMKLKKK